jgi:multidrug efflux pump subunit AcrB
VAIAEGLEAGEEVVVAGAFKLRSGAPILIVMVVIFLFLGSIRSVVVPVVAIPLSLVGAVFLMQLFGFTLNLLTLLAVVLSVGLVVDDAIVVVENVERHIREGRSRLDAALAGARELVGPIVAMTTTLVAVYIPIGFQGGLTGTLFREFALTLAGAVFISGVVALTLSPIMSSRLLAPSEGKRSRFERLVGRAFDAVTFLGFAGPPSLRFSLTEGWTTTLNIYSQVGLVTLVGLVAKNGILIVEFANTLQVRGFSKVAALREAALTRLRPVLMTSAATIFGHLPLVLVSGPGAEARNSIGIVLVAGMTVGTLFTLFVVPVFYSLIASQHQPVPAREKVEYERLPAGLAAAPGTAG